MSLTALQRGSVALHRASVALQRGSVALQRASVALQKASVALQRATRSRVRCWGKVCLILFGLTNLRPHSDLTQCIN